MKQKIFINIAEEKYSVALPKVYQKSYKDLYDTYNIVTYTFHIGTEESKEKYNFHTSIRCDNIENLQSKISEVYKTNEVVFINTFTEGLIEECNTIKKSLGESITTQHRAFRDKSLQRKFLQEHNPDLGIKYLTYSYDEISQEKIESFLGYPFIIKPSSGIQSAGVAIIHSNKDFEKYLTEYHEFLEKFQARGFQNDTLVFEEFIDGTMYSVDYYVGKNGEVIQSQPVHVGLGEDIGIHDFMNYVRSFREKTIQDIEQNRLNSFIEGTIQALGIKNTFIHHEFKLTSKGTLKTIEVNGRIGGYRLEMIHESFNFNWLSCVIGKIPDTKIQYNFSSFLVYPTKKCILQGFNTDIFSQVEKLSSIYFINQLQNFVGKEIGLTQEGFTKVAIIKIKNSNTKQFEEDYIFIEKNFKSLLITQ